MNTNRPRSESRAVVEHGKIQFLVKYHFIHEELESALLKKLFTYLEDTSMTSYTGFLTHFVRSVVSRVNFVQYAAQGRCEFGSLDESVLLKELSSQDENVRNKILETMRKFWETVREVKIDEVRQCSGTRTKMLCYNIEAIPPKVIFYMGLLYLF